MERSGTPNSPVFCGWMRRFTAQLRSKKCAIKTEKKVNAGTLIVLFTSLSFGTIIVAKVPACSKFVHEGGFYGQDAQKTRF
jgi:hypothetical protein